MIEPGSAIVRLALAYVRGELARGATLERAAVRLCESLAKLLGPSGFDVLLARALVLAKKAHPVLVGVATSPGGVLVGLGDSALDATCVEPAAVAVVANFIELLVVLIGEDLTMRLLHEALHEASNGAGAPPKETTQ